jgi:hypothetical protein
MPTQTARKIDEKVIYAAQNAQLGLITAIDLSLLTGIAVPQLNTYAKKGFLGHYGEYHGKRFFNFEEVMNWLNDPAVDEAKTAMQLSLKPLMEHDEWPFSIVKEARGSKRIKIIWKTVTPK